MKAQICEKTDTSNPRTVAEPVCNALSELKPFIRVLEGSKITVYANDEDGADLEVAKLQHTIDNDSDSFLSYSKTPQRRGKMKTLTSLYFGYK